MRWSSSGPSCGFGAYGSTTTVERGIGPTSLNLVPYPSSCQGRAVACSRNSRSRARALSTLTGPPGGDHLRELAIRIQSTAEGVVRARHEMPIRPLNHLKRSAHHSRQFERPDSGGERVGSERVPKDVGTGERVDRSNVSQRHPREAPPQEGTWAPLRYPHLQTASPAASIAVFHSLARQLRRFK